MSHQTKIHWIVCINASNDGKNSFHELTELKR